MEIRVPCNIILWEKKRKPVTKYAKKREQHVTDHTTASFVPNLIYLWLFFVMSILFWCEYFLLTDECKKFLFMTFTWKMRLLLWRFSVRTVFFFAFRKVEVTYVQGVLDSERFYFLQFLFFVFFWTLGNSLVRLRVVLRQLSSRLTEIVYIFNRPKSMLWALAHS